MHDYLHNRGYRALITASVLSGIGDSLYNIVFIIYASTTPFKTLAVSLASMATFLPNLLSMVTGYWADSRTGTVVMGDGVALHAVNASS